MKKIILVGMGGHSKVVKDIINLKKEFKVIGYLDDKIQTKKNVDGIIYDNIKSYRNYEDEHFCITIGNNQTREEIFKTLNLPLSKYPTLVHPTAIIGSNVEIGDGTVIMANVVVNADTKIGSHCIINTTASVGHDVIIDDYVHISPNSTLTGGVKVGSKSQIGASATIIPTVNIGRNTIVGAGATVVNNIGDQQVVIGTPAKPKE